MPLLALAPALASVAGLALALQVQPPQNDAELQELHRTWQESCEQRDYGAFDDVCQQIGDEIAAYERDRDARERRHPPHADSRKGDRVMAEPPAAPVVPQAPQPPDAGAPKPSAAVRPPPPEPEPGGIAADEAGATALARATAEAQDGSSG